ncbi:MAG: tetratricopeptide repeat protein [bacterium]|nr:tetratricopeptide repeat protein [bacterium]
MAITIELNDFAAEFRYPAQYDDVVEEFDDLLHRHRTGRLREKQYLGALKKLVEQHPWFIDGHVHIGNALHDNGEFKHALVAYERGYALGTAALPAGFTDHIPWGHLENRPFLRAAHGAALTQSKLGRHAESIEMLEKMLMWNPEDHQGVRFVIGSEYMREGEDEKAMSYFESGMGYPPYCYERALLLLRQGRFVESATSLRLGFVANGYIAEALCGNPRPLPVGIWHGNSWSGPDVAIDYASDLGKLWHQSRNAVAFLRWLHTHPKVMAERAGILQWREALRWERDATRRASITDRELAAWRGIDDRLSAEIVVERIDRFGQPVFPWLHPEGRLPYGSP